MLAGYYACRPWQRTVLAVPQVHIQLSVKTADGRKVLDTTRADEGGSGIPKVFVLGKGRRAPRGWELAVEGAGILLVALRL